MDRAEEVREKETRLRRLMDASGLEGVLLKKQANFAWLTGGGQNRINLATEAGVASLLLTRDRRFLLANRTEMRRLLQEEGLAQLGYEPLEYEWFEDRELELAKKITPDLTKVGADSEVPGARPLESELRRLRCSLTPPEIERFIFLGEQASLAVEKVLLGVRSGDSELAIAGRIGPELWPHGMDLPLVLVAADERIYSFRHPLPTAKLLHRQLLVAVNVRYKGLVVSLTRMLHCGRPSVALSRQHEHNLQIECRMIAATRPGAALSSIFATALAAYAEFGAAKDWQLLHQGGCIGYAGREYKITPTLAGVVEENQGFCFNPAITGTKTEDSFLVTNSGPLMLTRPVAFPAQKVVAGDRAFVRPGMLISD